MSYRDIIRAWKGKEYRRSLSNDLAPIGVEQSATSRSSQKLARLNTVAPILEHEVDGEGNVHNPSLGADTHLLVSLRGFYLDNLILFPSPPATSTLTCTA